MLAEAYADLRRGDRDTHVLYVCTHAPTRPREEAGGVGESRSRHEPGLRHLLHKRHPKRTRTTSCRPSSNAPGRLQLAAPPRSYTATRLRHANP